MKKVYLIKDEKVGFMNVVVDENDEVAKFSFGRGFYCEKPELGRLEDYSLYCVGDFSLSGGLQLYDYPIYVINGLVAYNDFVSRINSLQLEHLSMKGCDNCGDSNLEKETKE